MAGSALLREDGPPAAFLACSTSDAAAREFHEPPRECDLTAAPECTGEPRETSGDPTPAARADDPIRLARWARGCDAFLALADRRGPLVTMGILMVAAIAFLRHLGRADVCTGTEAVEALGVQAMVEQGHWLHPLLGGQYPMFKPPLFHWTASLLAMAAPTTLVSAWSIRLPSALYGLATLAMCMRFVARRVGSRAAVFTGLLLLSAYPFVGGARLGRVDMTLAFLEVASLLAFVAWFEMADPNALTGPGRGSARRLRRQYLLAVLLGLSFLTKGPIGALLPGMAIGAVLLLEGDREDRRDMLAAGPIVVALLVGVSWYLICAVTADWSTLRRQLGSENLGRFSGDLGQMSSSYYIKPLLLGAVPLGLLTPPSVVVALLDRWRSSALAASTKRASAWRVLLAIFWVIAVGVFSAASYKRRAYLLPLWPVGAILAPWAMTSFLSATGRAWCERALLAACVPMTIFNAAFAPWHEARECPAGQCAALAKQLEGRPGNTAKFQMYGMGIEEAAPLLFYLRRPVPLLHVPEPDLATIRRSELPPSAGGCGFRLVPAAREHGVLVGGRGSNP